MNIDEYQTELMEAVAKRAAAERAAGPRGSFTAYTERDGFAWYLIAGNWHSHHGAERVADTGYFGSRQRPRARLLMLWLMGAVPGEMYAVHTIRTQSFMVTDTAGIVSTVWVEAAKRVFPDFKLWETI